ncbi:Secreted and surface protein containing fasciclin-like repeat [Croceitalea dokdonensis DOKDO 023]|uniref:Secreted and surface protein containing fasciclin-like repeat n=1 Tax=Croceitalea dokdonensis DOKDO 023 TaxID=1300341 RepID=A0A0P7B279_9FLAO|nr:fasciclin domain-containing protein [Croceitalea dokdonensis]KPM33429.1 Secreted and surface protein containing fasciclin-like repeat [Croceitalea dokdonensis DOKDO 023]
MKTIKTLSVLALTAVLFTACGEKKKEKAEEVMEETAEAVTEVVEEQTTPNIVGVAVGNENFSTLVTAVTTAGLAETLSGDGPFTVFAPTNDAFAKLPEGTVASLLEPASKDALTGILTYHVVAGKYEAAAVIEAINANNGTFTVSTVQGGTIDLSLNDGKVMLTDAKGGTSTVIMADVAASNGVIHAIDTVVMPE